MNYIVTILNILIFTPLQILIKYVAIFLGLFLVPFVIKYSKRDYKIQPLKWQREGSISSWFYENIPKGHILWLWGNDRDGIYRDKRGSFTVWWGKSIFKKFNTNGIFYNYWWLAIRNPANNLRFLSWNSCDIRDCIFKSYGSNLMANNIPNGKGWQLTLAKKKYSFREYIGFTFWYPYTNKKDSRGLLIKLGNKINTTHRTKTYNDNIKYYKGTAFYINPFQNV